MDPIRMDALTVATCAWRLASRGRGPRDLAAALHDAVRRHDEGDGGSASLHGIRVSIRWSNVDGRPPIHPRGSLVDAWLDVDMTDHAGGRSRLLGNIARRGGGLSFRIHEIGLDDRTRLIRPRHGRLRLAVRQAMPETIIAAMPSRIGTPLATLVSHPAFEPPEAAGILIGEISPPRRMHASRVGLPEGLAEVGFDVGIDVPEMDVRPGR